MFLHQLYSCALLGYYTLCMWMPRFEHHWKYEDLLTVNILYLSLSVKMCLMTVYEMNAILLSLNAIRQTNNNKMIATKIISK